MPIILHKALQRSNSWFDVRAKTPVTSSIIDTILGRGLTYNQLVKDKALDISYNLSHIKAIEHGVKFEPVAIQALSKDMKIYDCGFVTNTEYPKMGVSPDGVIESYEGAPALLEVKCPYSRDLKKPIPKGYIHQVQLQMLVTGIHRCLFAQFSFNLYNGEELDRRLDLIEFDEEWYPTNKEKIDQYIRDISDQRSQEGASLLEMLQQFEAKTTEKPVCLLDF